VGDSPGREQTPAESSRERPWPFPTKTRKPWQKFPLDVHRGVRGDLIIKKVSIFNNQYSTNV